MYELIYIEVNAVCITILLYILYKSRSSSDKRAETVAFNNVVIATCAILILDIMWMLNDKKPGEFSYVLNCVINAVFLFLTGFISYLWLIFVNYKIKGSETNKKYLLLMALPLAVLAILCATSPWTKIIFYITDANAYMRGDGYLIQPIISYSYVITASVQVIRCMSREKIPQRRTELATLFSFFILPIIGSTLCILIYGLPTSWPCTTLSLLMVYINLQSYQISTDGLTELNNRRQFDKYLLGAVSDTHRAKRLFLFLMDIDDFKVINDTYGHLTGDAALVKTAKTLQEICQSKEAFLARYGGDEFALIFFCNKAFDAEGLKAGIECAFEGISDVSYKLTLSIGMAEYTPDHEALSVIAAKENLILMADAALYAAKEKKKKQKQ